MSSNKQNMTLEERRKNFEDFKRKAIAKAKRLNLRVAFPDGSVYDFRKKKQSD